MNRIDFLQKWGTDGWRLVIEQFISRAPSFQGDEQLAKTIGEIVADLNSVLEIPSSPNDRLRRAIFGDDKQ